LKPKIVVLNQIIPNVKKPSLLIIPPVCYHKKKIIPGLQEVLGAVDLPERNPLQHRICPACKKGKLITITTFTARGPPKHWLDALKNQENKCQ